VIPLFVLPFTLLVVLASTTSGDMKSLRCEDHHPIKIEGGRERLVTASPVMTKSWGPSWGKQLPGERSCETAETWHTGPQPSLYVRSKGAAPLSGAEEQTARAIGIYAQYACLHLFANGSIN
jgi:hypothetical protein